MMTNEELIERARAKARYAKASYSRPLVYEAIGFCEGLFECGRVTWADIREIHEFLVRDGLNNPEWVAKEKLV